MRSTEDSAGHSRHTGQAAADRVVPRPHRFDGAIARWPLRAGAPAFSNRSCLLTVDGESVQLTRQFPWRALLASVLLVVIVLVPLGLFAGWPLMVGSVYILVSLFYVLFWDAIRTWRKARRFSLARVANAALCGTKVIIDVLAPAVGREQPRAAAAPAGSRGRYSDQELAFQMEFRAAHPKQAARLQDLLLKWAAGNPAQEINGNFAIHDFASHSPFTSHRLTVDAASVTLRPKFWQHTQWRVLVWAAPLLVVWNLPELLKINWYQCLLGFLWCVLIFVLLPLLKREKLLQEDCFSLARIANVELHGSQVKFNVSPAPIRSEAGASDAASRVPEEKESAPDQSLLVLFRAANREEAAALRDCLPGPWN